MNRKLLTTPRSKVRGALTEDGKAQCGLWEYRYGRNPHRVFSPKQLEVRKKALVGLQLYQNRTAEGLEGGV